MIEQRIYTTEDGRELIHTSSDICMKIRQIETGIIYEEAIDVPNKYTYEETNIPIETDSAVSIRTADLADAALILFGEEQ